MHSNTIQNNSDLPPELCAKPLALVGVSGLDVVKNPIHKAIWETFSSNRRLERTPVLFKLMSNSHEFPVIKPRRNSYDWYIPKGILKKNWMSKHLYEVPAVVVIFFDLDWNDPQWNEKMIECASRVQSMRASLEGHSTRLTVVLIQNTVPLPAGEDSLSAERALALSSSCDLNSQYLFVLPHGDHLQGYAIRLESAFFELAQIYYHNEGKHIKSHKEHLNKNTHQYLFVRHQFKMGFMYEMKQDAHSAHKHYTHAYNSLLEIRIVDTNALEIRTVAGFINYKLCRLLFALNLPRDAISQFKAHIDRFKARMGFQELAFEHYAWLSKQYSVFGDIFDEAVKQGLPAVQTQHPGLYYQQAAQYAIQRKKSCQELCSAVIAYPHPDPLEGWNHMEFYGQRPWRPGKMSGDVPDPQLESNGIQALQFLEKHLNHSSLIIALYGLAITQFKTYRCPRTRRHLVLQMADEYYDSKDYGKALTLYTHMLWDFRIEKWWGILSQILEKAIRCAYLTANIQDYVLLAIELLGSNVLISLDEKRRIYENLVRILKKQIPFGDSKLPQDVLQNAIILWQPVFSEKPLSFSLDMANIVSCIATKARFLKNSYEVDQNVSVEIYVKSTCPFPLAFSKVSVTINTQGYTSEFAVTNLEGVFISFHKDEVKKFVVEFMADSSDINKEIQIASINLVLGSPNEFSLDLKYSPEADTNANHLELSHFKYNPDMLNFDNIHPLSQAAVVPRESKLKVEFDHQDPALLGEWYEIQTNVFNKEIHAIRDIKVEVRMEEDIPEVELSLKPIPQHAKQPTLLVNSESLNPEEKFACRFFIRSNLICKFAVQVIFIYTLDGDKSVLSTKTEKLLITVVEPFELTSKFLSLLMNDIDRFYAEEEFGIMKYLRFTSPWPIIVEDTSFSYTAPFVSTEREYVSQLANKMFHSDEIGAELHLAMCEKKSDANLNIGKYSVRWKRQNGHSTVTALPIAGLICDWIPIGLKMVAPSYGFLRTPMILSYHVQNRSQELVHLELAMEASEAFMFSGYKQFSVSVLPNSTRTLQYNLNPLIAGNVALPKFSLKSTENGDEIEECFVQHDEMDSLTKRTLPTHIYVMPQVKGNPKSTASFIQGTLTEAN
nr:trafficking protein particle complex subunit 11 [Leptinotarsa decemlineata]